MQTSATASRAFDEPLLEKVPPYAEEAERRVLGAILLDNNAFYTASATLVAEDFFHHAHRTLFDAMVALIEREQRVDVVLLSDHLVRRGMLEQVGGLAYLSELPDRAASSIANLEHHARLIKEKAILRRLIEVGHRLMVDGFDASKRAEEILEETEHEIIELSRSGVRSQVLALGPAIETVIKLIEARSEDPSAVPGLGTGLIGLDQKTGGLHPGQLVILAGRTSHGKTVLALNIAHHVAVVQHQTVVVFSLEMTCDELAMRLLCAEAMVDSKKVQKGYASRDDWVRLTQAANVLSDAPMFLDDSPAIGLMEIRAKARRLQAERGLGLVVVDYLQLMHTGRGAENRQQEIATISRGLKVLAKDLHVPVLALSQLSRKVDERPTKRPQLSDLRESGAIEQDADVVLFIFRPDRAGTGPAGRTNQEGRAEVIIGKQRNGPTGLIPVAFLGQCMRFENLAPEEGGPPVELYDLDPE